MNENIDDESKANVLQTQNEELHWIKTERDEAKLNSHELNEQLKLVRYEKEAIGKSLDGSLNILFIHLIIAYEKEQL